MADFYYRYNNASSNMILNDAYMALPNPVTSGLHRRFKASDFVNKQWKESVIGNSVTASGNVSSVTHVGDKKYRPTSVVSFDTTGSVSFGNNILSLYTLFTVTRYSGATKKRIIDGVSTNFLSGHWDGKAGVAYHNHTFITPQVDIHGMNFFIGTDVPTQYYSNGILRGTNTTTGDKSIPVITVYAGMFGESSDCQVLDIILYSRELSDTEKKKVEHYLASYYGLMDTAGSLTANYGRTPLSTEKSLLVSTTASPNWIIYPSFILENKGLTFAFWFRANSTPDWSRLIDFGTGLGYSQTHAIQMAIVSGNLALSVGTSGSIYFQLHNVFSGCNDNVWRHVVWTISADGLTWNIYINRVLQASVTSANKASYSPNQSNTTGPFHPVTSSTLVRDTNFLGKSTYSQDAALNGSIEDFQFYNYPIDQTTINNTWSMNSSWSLATNRSLIPKYARERLGTETSMLVSTPTNRNYIIYPAFSIQQTGLTFAMWFRSNANPQWYRIFDFGTDIPTNDTIGIFTNGSNLGIFVNNVGFYSVLPTNVISNYNDNVWRHLVWTISADGLTYRFYINKTLVTTLDSSNYTNAAYGSFFQNPPVHPIVGLRSSNFIFRSNQPNEVNNAVDGAVHAFQMWNTPLDQTAINSLYTDTAFSGTYTLSQFPNLTKSQSVTSFTIEKPLSTGTGDFTYTSSNPAVATVENDIVTVKSLGTTTITASQWTSSISSTLSVVNVPVPTFGTFTVPTVTFGASPFTITQPSSNSTGAFTYSSSNTSIATISGSTITVVSAGSVTITATQASDATYAQGSTTATFTINKATPTLGTFTVSTVTFGSIPFTLTPPTSNSIGSFTYTSSNTGVATISGSTLTVLNVGSATITATQLTTVNYLQASTTATFTINKAAPTLGAFTISTVTFGASPFLIVSPTSNSNGVFTYASLDPTIASISGSTLTVVSGGSVTITATQLTTVNYLQASTTATFTINKTTPTLGTFTVQNQTLGYPPFTITPPGSNSSGSFSYTSSNTSIVTVSSNIATLVGLGTVTVTATQATTSNYLQATRSSTFTVSSSVAYLSVNLDVGSIPIPLEGTSFVSSNPSVATVSRNQITFLSSGTTTITSNLNSSTNPLKVELTVTRKGLGFIYKDKDIIDDIDKSSIQSVTIRPTTTCQTLAISGKNLYKKNIQVTLDGVSNVGDTTLTFGKKKPNLWVAAGSSGNTLSYSTDGINWNGLGNSIFLNDGRCVSWNGRMWVAGGVVTNTLAYSYDGITWTGLGMTIFNTGCFAFAWNGTIWVAGGSITNTLAYSYDGINWIGLGNSIFSNWCGGIGWNGKMFIACGSGTNGLAYSYDGINWAGLGLSILKEGDGAAWNGTLWVAGGEGSSPPNTIAYSYDGVQWTGLGTTLFTNAYNVAWNGTVFVMLGNGPIHTMAYSYDGMLWNGLGKSIFSTLGFSISWNGQMFVAGGQGTHSLAYSYDGITWTGLGSNMASLIYGVSNNNAYENSIKIKKRMMIAGGEGVNTLAYSYDGISWKGIGNSIFSNRCYSIRWNGILWVATGYSNYNFAYSYDGIKWFGNTANNIMGLGICLAWNGTLWTAGGVSSATSFSLASSSDGINWTGRDKTIITDTCYGMASNGKRFVAVGNGTNSIAYSDNGTSWTGLGLSIFTTGMCVSWNGTMFVAGGSGNNQIAYSYDGIVWIGLGTLFTTTPHDVANNGTMWVMVGGQKGAYSYDGKRWNLYDLPFFTGVLYAGAMYVSWNGYLWVVVGGSGTSQMAYSTNGINWTTNPNKIFTDWGTAIGSDWTGEATSFSLYQPMIACGSGTHTLAYSNDGITWTGLGKTIFDLWGGTAFYNGTLWVAGGKGTNSLAYSYDGFTWTGLSTTLFSDCQGLLYYNNLWVAGGFGTNTLAYSSDGLNWTGLGTSIFTTGCLTFATNGNLWIAGGYGTNTMAYSYNGTQWTANAATPFGEVCYGIAWNGTVWVAVGNGSPCYSYDGIVWARATSDITRGRAVVWNGTLFGVIGDPSNLIAYSVDGIFWTSVIYTTFNGIPRGLLWTGDKWIIFAENSPTMKYSFDGKTWINTNSTVFTTGLSGAVADGRLSDTLYISTDAYYQTGYNTIIYSTSQTN